jgi:hypothetical protein
VSLTPKKKTISNTTKKEGGGGFESQKVAPGGLIQHTTSQNGPAPATTKHLLLILIFTKLGIKEKFHKTWEKNMFRECVQEQGKPREGSQVGSFFFPKNNENKK